MNLQALFSPGFAFVAAAVATSVVALVVVAVVYALRLGEDPQAPTTASARTAAEPIADTLLVVIAAAVTAAVGRSRIRRVRRLPAADMPASPWSVTGRAVLQGSHVVPSRSLKP